jgi:hypothetical protein
MSITIHCNIHGSIVNGMAEREINRYKAHIIDTVSDKAVTDIRNYLPTQYMYLGHHGGTPETNPVPANAGALEAAIHSEHQSPNASLVSDDPITYGAWIEGIDPANFIVWPHRRNPPPRRFPGYFTFRKIATILQAGEAGLIAERELPPYLTAMNI